VIRIPLNGPYFLNAPDSYLKFETYITQNTTADATVCRLDSSAHTYIQRLRIEGPDGAYFARARRLGVRRGNAHSHFLFYRF